MKVSLILAAGGSSSRFRESLPPRTPSNKLFMPLGGKPLFLHSLPVFHQHPEIAETLIAVPQNLRSQVKRLLTQARFENVKVVNGGASRAESVMRALRKSNPRNEWVMVHDAARPFVSSGSLQKLLQAAPASDGVILAKKVVPTLKQVDASGKISATVDRSQIFEAETPQLVRRKVLEKAYRENPQALQATDEASLLESVKATVRVVAHESWNPKVTHFQDFELAEAFLNSGAVSRTGLGKDTHRLVAGRKLMLGGLHVPFEKGCLGHSDGDALLHAIADALLGAAAMGDIGEWFSDRDPRFKNIASSKMLEQIAGAVKKQGWHVEHVDSVVILEKPKLGPLKKKMQEKIAALLKIKSDQVSIKAKTAEGLGPEGEGLSVTCEAIATLRKKS